MKKYHYSVVISLFFFLLFPAGVRAQDEGFEKPSKVTFGGYLKQMSSVSFSDVKKDWISDQIIHNRLNFKWYASDNLTFVAEVRSRMLYGETVKNLPGYAELASKDFGTTDLSFLWFSEKSVFLYSQIDRFYLDWTKGKVQLIIGRQRINWGRTLVWNPNDVFNAYSFFDFDYEERPGSDAVLFRYYTGELSSLEIAAELTDDPARMTAAALFKFNRAAYDFQLLAGRSRGDWLAGAGWSGNIKNAGFKGEMTYFRPAENFARSEGVFVAAISADYTFKNSLMIQADLIYNSRPTAPSALFMLEQLTAKRLTTTSLSVFSQISYPFTPLVFVGLGGIVNPTDGSFYLGPSLSVSLSDNVEWAVFGQVFEGSSGSAFGGSGAAFFSRLKWSF